MNLDKDAKAVWAEIAPGLKAKTPDVIVEAMVRQIQTMREARRLVELDGHMVRDGKDNPVRHPALQIEAEAQATLQRLLLKWAGQ